MRCARWSARRSPSGSRGRRYRSASRRCRRRSRGRRARRGADQVCVCRSMESGQQEQGEARLGEVDAHPMHGNALCRWLRIGPSRDLSSRRTARPRGERPRPKGVPDGAAARSGDLGRMTTGQRPGGRRGALDGDRGVGSVVGTGASTARSDLPFTWTLGSKFNNRGSGGRVDSRRADPSGAGTLAPTRDPVNPIHPSPTRGAGPCKMPRGRVSLRSIGPEPGLRAVARARGPTGTKVIMNSLTSATLARLWDDFDAREELLRDVVADRLAASPPPAVDDHVVATYYFAFRTQTLAKAVEEISYHATSGIKNPPKGSLLEQCSARQAGVDAFDASGRIGLLARRVPAQDDAASRRTRDLVRPAAHGRRRGHLRHVREPGRPPGLAADPRRRPGDVPRPGLRADRHPEARRASRSISPPSARSSSPRPGSRPTTSSGWSRRSPAARS